MARNAKSTTRKTSRRVGRKGGAAPAVPRSQPPSPNDAVEAAQPLMPAIAPLFTTAIKLDDLGKALPNLHLLPLSSHLRTPHPPPKFPTPALGPPSKTVPINSVEALGAMVRSYREALSMSQQSFAERVGVGRRFISELENGKPSLEFDKVLSVARAAGIDLFAALRSPPP